ncbi:hypothetical protein [Porphyrobacter sp. YT40]|uniref:hypothetical protein n=1 Tax=Porphyrobacter sp. YT40 TaxID=2547601 RepID=UPI0011440AEE|nr:hypothetical protein [Porphyrobacter sp. YT40]QDH33264.1 hypothetical protein E2E27_02270 [Porphyrobacter sp. YT40]
MLALAGCGGGDSSLSPAPPPVQTAPTLTSAASASVVENTTGIFYTATASDPQNDPVSISLFSGPDADKLVLQANGGLRFNQTPNFDLPVDANGDNIYEVTLRVTAGGESRDFPVRITVTNDREGIIVRRAATGIVEPVAVGQMFGQPKLLIAERSGRILQFDMTNDALTEDTFIRDNRLPGVVLSVAYGFPGNPYQRGIYLVTHSPATGLILQAFDETRGAFSSIKLADSWTQPVTVSFIQLPRTMLAIGSPTEALAQDATSFYGKLVELEVFNPNAVASVPDPTTIPLLPRIIGDGIRQPGGFSNDGGVAVLADRGGSLQHELTAFRPEWRPLDFGWPFYEGSASTRSNPPAAVNGPNVTYPFGTGRKQGTGIIAGQFFKAIFDPVFKDSYIFFDTNGSVFLIRSTAFTNGFINTAGVIEDRTQDLVPDQGQIGTLVGYAPSVNSTVFYLLDSDGELFEVSQQQP